LLIITQKVDRDDSVLGFFHRWIEEFSKNVESVIVITLFKGNYSLPSNVKVLSLGKEDNNFQFSIFNFQKIQYLFRFYRYIWQERNNYDTVFVHMNQIYVLLGGFFWKIMKKPIGLWYTHKNTRLSLKVAVSMVNHIFSASKESFRVVTPKLNVVGHGIDVDLFKEGEDGEKQAGNNLLTIGRISPVKNLDIIIEAVKELEKDGVLVNLQVVGDAIYPSDKIYLDSLKQAVKGFGLGDRVHFLGKVSNENTPELYRNADIFINLSDTGSMDKVVLEAMSCGTKVLTSNEAFNEILAERYKTAKNSADVARHIRDLLLSPRDNGLREFVQNNHNLKALIPKILDIYLKK
jgi:glycosyltransferase involved in cell wall biosynthesis